MVGVSVKRLCAHSSENICSVTQSEIDGQKAGSGVCDSVSVDCSSLPFDGDSSMACLDEPHTFASLQVCKITEILA